MRYSQYDDVANNMISEFNREGYLDMIEELRSDLRDKLGYEPSEDLIDQHVETFLDQQRFEYLGF